jgi:hypothetical protein
MIWVAHLVSRIQILIFYPSRILDPRVEKAPDRGSRIQIRNTDINSGICIYLQICKLKLYDFQHYFFLVNSFIPEQFNMVFI